MVQDFTFRGRNEAGVRNFLLEFVPQDLAEIARIEQKVQIPPVWRVDIGNYVQFTFIENQDHSRNKNWTSTLDAKYYDLRKEELRYQPDFTRVCQLTGKKPIDLIINNRARNADLRFAYHILPQVLDEVKDEKIIKQLLPALQAPIQKETFGTRFGMLIKRIDDFCQNHIEGEGEEEAVKFHKNMSQIIKKLPPEIFNETEQELLKERLTKIDEDYNHFILQSDKKEPRLSPTKPNASAASSRQQPALSH